MTDLHALPAPLISALTFLNMCSALLAIWDLLLSIQRKRGFFVCAYCTLLFFLCYAFNELIIYTAVPLPMPLLIPMLLIPLLALERLFSAMRYRRTHIVPESVKESIDKLPVGVCCYWPGGQVKLLNESMEALSYAVTGGPLLDGSGFWDRLTRGEGRTEFLQTGDAPVIRLPDGTVRSFSHSRIRMGKGELCEILAMDRTGEYELNARLLEKRRQVQDFNRRMRALGGVIEQMVTEKEVLSVKVRIHDDLSRLLLTARQYYADRGGVSREELQRLWDRTVRLLQNEGPENWRDSYEYAVQTAREFGVALNVSGEVPKDAPRRTLIASALITCLSNAVRHAGADRLDVNVTGTDGGIAAVITNNGSRPEGPIRETGGLGNLRRQIEAAGGKMRVESAPYFALILELPGERGETGYGI